MAAVTKCDVCGTCVPHQKSYFVSIYKVTKDNKCGDNVAETDVCQECFKRIKGVMKID